MLGFFGLLDCFLRGGGWGGYLDEMLTAILSVNASKLT